MKIFYKKDYFEALEALNSQSRTIGGLVISTKKLKLMNKALGEEINRLRGAKGGYVRQIHKLEKELAELKEKYKDGYAVIKLPSEKVHQVQKMKIRSNARESKIARNLKKGSE